ncbi:MAG: hypothetical protein IPI77_24115 [Saprospiraceae bacterium]|nr:hypothetical protein [Saprospiraceae bacterium]
MLLWGFLIGTLVFCGLAPSYSLLVLARILAGLFGGLIGAQVLAIISDIFGYERRGWRWVRGDEFVCHRFYSGCTLCFVLATHSARMRLYFSGSTRYWADPFIGKYIPVMKEHVQDKVAPNLQILRKSSTTPNRYKILIFSLSIMLGHF